MRLTLSVLTLQEQAPFTSMTHSFDQTGGSVGRHQRAGWVLLDDKKFLSGEHFSINCDGKNFFVVDTSTNGTFVNDEIHPLGKNNSHLLVERDRIRIGEYIIICSISLQSAVSQQSFPVSNHPSSSSGGDPNDPFFSSGGHFDSSTASNSHDDSLQTHDPYAASSKSSFVDPNMAGIFGQANSVEDSSDPFFSSDESFSPHETPFNKALDENIMEADNGINIHTPLTATPVSNRQQIPTQAPNEKIFGNADNTEDSDVFDFLDTENTENKEEKPTVYESPLTPSVQEPIVDDKVKASATDLKNQEEEEEDEVVPSEKEEIKNSPPETSKEKEQPKRETEKPKSTESTSISSDSEALRMFLKGAGITKKHIPSEVPPETFEIIGHALKEVLQGTIGLLKARAETKNHLHLDRTIIGNIENNPLKFMPNAEQVIVHLLTNENNDRTYTPLDKALEEAFDDIMAHQFAMTVATQSALKGVIKQHFSPQNLADNMAKTHPISSLIPLQRQAKLWSMFESLYDDVEKEAAESFSRLLDNEIASAYEKQLMELKSLRIKKYNSNEFPE